MFSLPQLDSRRATALPVVLVGAMFALAACDSSSDEGQTLQWEADLVGGVAYPDVDGTASVIATSTVFTASIQISNAEPDDIFTWQVAAGSCTAPGARVGTADLYTDLEVDDDGDASEEAVVSAALNDGGDYIALVLDESGITPVTVVCGPFMD